MRILTVRQPWAWAIVHGGKTVENRSRNIAGEYRGPVAIHAGLVYDRSEEALTGPVRAAMDAAAVAAGAQVFAGGYTWGIGQPDPRKAWSVFGAIIGVVDLVDVHPAYINDVACGHDARHLCSEWAEYEGHHLVLDNPRALATPIPARGRLGLWRPDAELEAQIEEALS